MKKTVLQWELAGIVSIALAGSALHFAFGWSNYWRPLALVAAVNESTYEHLKLAFWPGLVFALVEYPFIRRLANNFLMAKALGLLNMPIVIVALFYGYKAILGQDYLLADIMIFVLAVALGQTVSYRLLTADAMRPSLQRYALIGLITMTAAFSLLTYCPPRLFLFEDPLTSEYGILETCDE